MKQEALTLQLHSLIELVSVQMITRLFLLERNRVEGDLMLRPAWKTKMHTEVINL